MWSYTLFQATSWVTRLMLAGTCLPAWQSAQGLLLYTLQLDSWLATVQQGLSSWQLGPSECLTGIRILGSVPSTQ